MGTLVEDPFHRTIPAYFGLTLDELLAAKHPTAWVDFEGGRLTAEEYYGRMFADSRPVDGKGLESALVHAYRFLDGIEELLTELAARGTPMHAFSNYPVWYHLVEARLGLSRWVPWTFVSCNTGLRKPAREAFLGAARGLALPPERCLFVDDRPVNCDAAAAAGMRVLGFESAPALRRQLLRLGVL